MSMEYDNRSSTGNMSNKQFFTIGIVIVVVILSVVIGATALINPGLGREYNALSKALDESRVKKNYQNLRMLSEAVYKYAHENGDFPESLDPVIEKYGLSEKITRSAMDDSTPYIYTKPVSRGDGSGDRYEDYWRYREPAVLLYDPIVVDGEVMAVFAHGRVRNFPVKEFRNMLAEQWAECKLIEK